MKTDKKNPVSLHLIMSICVAVVLLLVFFAVERPWGVMMAMSIAALVFLSTIFSGSRDKFGVRLIFGILFTLIEGVMPVIVTIDPAKYFIWILFVILQMFLMVRILGKQTYQTDFKVWFALFLSTVFAAFIGAMVYVLTKELWPGISVGGFALAFLYRRLLGTNTTPSVANTN